MTLMFEFRGKMTEIQWIEEHYDVARAWRWNILRLLIYNFLF
jgi:hypothetical protein